MSYTSVTISGYNSNPPPNDGSTGTANNVTWTKIKTKLFDPIKSGLDTIDDNISSAVTTADTTLATLNSDISTLSSQVSALPSTMKAPASTVMLFRQTSAPTGWTKGTLYDDYALRLVTGSASTGGSTAFTSVFASRTIATANLPAHTHTFSDGPDALTFTSSTTFLTDVTDGTTTGDSGGSNRITNVTDNTATVSGTYSFSVSTSSTSGTNDGGWDFAVQYVDTIYATKS